ncbi:WXG100 family type VII secretion target [Streptomyces sp. SYP-A7185]|uniref:WXG100 family type VII secretion target n=1 Tax=Streptomyces sp. SYP-A7185 TaxID=3040076 RepID=UPI0038F7F6D8
MAEDPGMTQWRADLAALKEAIGVVERESTSISETMAAIDSKSNDISTHWNSPSYGTFDEIKTWFQTSQHDLEALLKDIVHRMHTSYTNYHNAENANYDNVSDGQSGA